MATPLSATKALAAFKAEGISVQEVGSWRTHNRNSKGAWGPVHGVMLHHTVSSADASSVSLCYNGRTGLPGPLCHGVGRTDGKLALVGWGRANHAGLGDDDVLKAVIAESKLPADNEANTDGNSRFYGLEIVNNGDNRDVYQWEQYECAIRFAAALCRAHGWDEKSVIGHLEWQPGKIDPRGPVEGEGSFTMAMARGDVKACLAQGAGKWKLHAAKPTTPAPTTPRPPSTTIVPKSRESEATVTTQAKKALEQWPFIRAVETKYGLPAGLLLAVGSRETNLRNTVGDGGHGHGVWQQDDRWWPGMPDDFDQDVEKQAEKAGDMLADSHTALKNWSHAIAAYNKGVQGVKDALAAGKSPDSITPGGDYAADVLGRQKYTAAVMKLAPQRPTEWVQVTGYLPVIRKGDTGWYVGWAQRNLNRLVDPNCVVTGVYDAATAAAVKRFYKEELAYDATGNELAAGGWARLLSMAKNANGEMA